MALRFRPPSWSWLAFLPTFGLLLTLGAWQIDRGQDKARLVETLERAFVAPAVELETLLDRVPDAAVTRVAATGRFIPQRSLLLDNQGRDRQPGYHIWTPFELESGAWVIVDRGWVPRPAHREVAPETAAGEETRRLTGFWRSLPEPGLRLAAADCENPHFPVIVQYPSVGELVCLLERPVLDGLVLLDPLEPEGFVREWSVGVEVPPERHYAYAAQWFAFAVTLLVLFVRWSLKTDG